MSDETKAIRELIEDVNKTMTHYYDCSGCGSIFGLCSRGVSKFNSIANKFQRDYHGGPPNLYSRVISMLDQIENEGHVEICNYRFGECTCPYPEPTGYCCKCGELTEDTTPYGGRIVAGKHVYGRKSACRRCMDAGHAAHNSDQLN